VASLGWILLTVAAAPRAHAERAGLVIVHTNDSHSNLLPVPAPWREDRPLVGGVVALEALVRAERARWRNVLVLDAGDILTGTPLTDLELGGLPGGVVVDLLDRVGYDAGTIGNHEFDLGAETLDRLIKRTRHRRLLCANLNHPDGTPYAPEPGAVFRMDGLTVGVVGLITDDLASLLTDANLSAARVLPPAEAARAWIASLGERPDVLVALTHMGVEADEQLARDVPDFDVIVGGHSHTRLTEPRKVGRTLIVQTGGQMREAGVVRLEVEAAKVVVADASLVSLFSTNVRQNDKLAELCARHDQQIKGEYGEKIADLAVAWKREHGRDSNVGSWLCDALADAFQVDFGFLNSGGLRKNLPAGAITRLDVLELLPFDNEVVTFEATGEELLAVLHYNATQAAEGDKGVLQMGHLTARWRRGPSGVELVAPTVRAQPIDPARTYRGVSIDFVVYSQAETYMGRVPRARQRMGERISAAVERCIRSARVIGVEADGRLTEVRDAPAGGGR
jgi:2',3'-cyclic-nucleotide 2'-phosphodiesterase (5'-nucleotidase family)